MKNKIQILLMAVAVVLAGCATDNSKQSQPRAEKAPRYANNVKVLMYDSSTRPTTDHLDFYDANPPERPYKVIALLTYEANPDEEVVVKTAIYYRARQIGAEAVMNANTVFMKVQDPFFLGTGGGFGGGGRTRCIFRVKAIVYEAK